MSEPSKTNNYRPRQSCLRCRQRKIKCNRLQPCLACSKRGLGAECSYVTNDEDRFQISQANIISDLRKEVNHLKRKLAHYEESSNGFLDNGVAGALYGSASSGSPALSRPFKIPKRMVDAHPDGQSCLAMAPAPPAPAFAPFISGSMPGHNHIFNPSGVGSAGLVPSPPLASSVVAGDDLMAGMGMPVTLQQGSPQAMDYGPNYPSIPFVTGPDQNHMTAGLVQHQQPDLWKGKEDLLRALYDIIRDCDDSQVPTILDIVRNSTSPEEALSLAQQVLITSPSSTNSSTTYDSLPS